MRVKAYYILIGTLLLIGSAMISACLIIIIDSITMMGQMS